MSAEPWQCPSCKTWMAPGVTEHRCEPPEAGVAAPVMPVTPTGDITVSGIPDGWTVSYTTTSGTSYELNPAQPLTATLHVQVDGRQLARTVQEHSLRSAARGSAA